MRLVKKVLIFIIALYIGAVAFMPKEQLYYYLEHKLQEKGVVIGNEKLENKGLSLNILHLITYFQGADIARVSKVSIKPLLFINSVEVDDIEFLNLAKDYLNLDVKVLKLNHTVLKPFKVKIDANGSFGVAHGEMNLKTRVLHIDIVEPKDINSIKRYLKKGAKGWYYETRF